VRSYRNAARSIGPTTIFSPGPGARIVVGPIDLAALRSERRRRKGHDLLGHIRAEAYRELYARTIYPPGGEP
jgi:hypothetical protein